MHVIFQRHHIPPHVVYAWETKHKRFAYESMAHTLAQEARERKEVERRRTK